MSRPCSALISSGENALSWAMRSEEHTSELQSLRHLYAVFCLRSEEHTSELQSLRHLVCRLLLEKKKDPRAHDSPSAGTGNAERSPPNVADQYAYRRRYSTRCHA